MVSWRAEDTMAKHRPVANRIYSVRFNFNRGET